MVVAGAEENPFYVEELIKMLIDRRVIVHGAGEWGVDASRLGEVRVPPTLTGVLQARPVGVGGRDFDAAACFAESLRVFAAIKMEAERARALRDWAGHELASGDRARGREMWREAREIFMRLGMELEVGRTSEDV
jgi:hypothetical protein